MTARYFYRGTTEKGRGYLGQIRVDDLPSWVERLFVHGWRRLTVTRDGREVAGITRLDDGRRRTWWAEQ